MAFLYSNIPLFIFSIYLLHPLNIGHIGIIYNSFSPFIDVISTDRRLFCTFLFDYRIGKMNIRMNVFHHPSARRTIPTRILISPVRAVQILSKCQGKRQSTPSFSSNQHNGMTHPVTLNTMYELFLDPLKPDYIREFHNIYVPMCSMWLSINIRFRSCILSWYFVFVVNFQIITLCCLPSAFSLIAFSLI